MLVENAKEQKMLVEIEDTLVGVLVEGKKETKKKCQNVNRKCLYERRKETLVKIYLCIYF